MRDNKDAKMTIVFDNIRHCDKVCARHQPPIIVPPRSVVITDLTARTSKTIQVGSHCQLLKAMTSMSAATLKVPLRQVRLPRYGVWRQQLHTLPVRDCSAASHGFNVSVFKHRRGRINVHPTAPPRTRILRCRQCQRLSRSPGDNAA